MLGSPVPFFCAGTILSSFGLLCLLNTKKDYHRNQTATTLKYTRPHAARTNITVHCVISQVRHLAYEILTPTVLCTWGQQLGSGPNITGGSLIPWCIKLLLG